MPLYYFEIGDLPDDQSCELVDVEAARMEARRLLAAAIMRADVLVGECKTWSCIVRDEHGRGLIRIVVATLVEVPGGPPQDGRQFQPV